MGIIQLISSVRHSSLSEELPNEFEQDTVRAYVCDRELCRPDATIKKLFLKLSFVFGITLISALLLLKGLTKAFLLYNGYRIELSGNYSFFIFLYFSLFFSIVCFLYLKRFLIELIRTYQHYAPDEVRRRCLFMPTCSEYTIIALEKYGVVLGLYKAYIRIFKKCRGNIYRVDNP